MKAIELLLLFIKVFGMLCERCEASIGFQYSARQSHNDKCSKDNLNLISFIVSDLSGANLFKLAPLTQQMSCIM